MAESKRHKEATFLTAAIALSGAATAVLETVRSRGTDEATALAVARQQLEREYADKERDEHLQDLTTNTVDCLDIATENRRRLDKLELAAEYLAKENNWLARKSLKAGAAPEEEKPARREDKPERKIDRSPKPRVPPAIKAKRAVQGYSVDQVRQRARDLGFN